MFLEITAIVLILFLVARELAGVSGSARAERAGRYLLVPIIPLLALYAVLLVQRLNVMLSP